MSQPCTEISSIYVSYHAAKPLAFCTRICGVGGAGHYVIIALFAHMACKGYLQSDKESCLLYRINGEGTKIVSVTMDDVLVLGSTQIVIEQFYQDLSDKCTVKLLGKPTDFLDWTITHGIYGWITPRQPTPHMNTIATADFEGFQGHHTHYDYIDDLRPPEDFHVHLYSSEAKYRQLIRGLRYLDDCTRKDMCYVTGCLGVALHRPNLRHWRSTKAVILHLA